MSTHSCHRIILSTLEPDELQQHRRLQQTRNHSGVQWTASSYNAVGRNNGSFNVEPVFAEQTHDVVETTLCIYYALIILLTIRPGNRGESRFYVTGVQERLLLQIVRLHLYDVALIADASSLAWKPQRPAEVSKEMHRCRSQYLKSWSCRTPECKIGRMCFMLFMTCS